MLQDPAKDVLVPFTLAEAEELVLPELRFANGPEAAPKVWQDLSGITLENGVKTLNLDPFLSLLDGDVPESVSYTDAYSIASSGTPAAAASAFLALAASGEHRGAALFGFALAIAEAEQYAQAELLAEFVATTPGLEDPRAYALAGFCAFCRKSPNATRVHLAKASRLARASMKYRKVQKYAQRILLVQQFSTGIND